MTEDVVVKEVEAVLASPRARAAFAAMAAEREPDPRPLYRLLGDQRLLAVNWPTAYGGRDLSGRCAAAVVGALIAGGVPEVLHTLSVQICGNFLLAAGSAEQRAALLPGLASGAITMTVLYSEPDVGSDLSALGTTAEPDGTGWRIRGRKVYSVKTSMADYGLVAARTSAEVTQYQGISLFLVPLDAPGVTVEALDSLADEDFADVRLDEVHVPAAAVVGPVGGAWPLITEALALERTGVDYVAKADLWLRTAPESNGRLRTRVAAARALSMRCVDSIDAGRVDPVGAAATKHWTSETARAVAWWCTDIGAAREPGRLESAYREAPGLTISAGTSEMMLELVANSGLPSPEADFPAGEEALAGELRKAVRAIATAYDERDPARACWPDLERLGVFDLAGSLGLGLRAQVIACAELGRELHDDGVLDHLGGDDSQAVQRIRRAAWLTGLAASCLARTVHRARTREQFGRPLITNQDVAFRLARLKIHHDAVWALVTDLAGRHDDGAPDPALAAGALAEAGTLALATTREAVQLHGAFGMTAASPVRRHYLTAPVAVAADAPIAELYAAAAGP
ncbi:acyl-CoA dehydrogenase [Labedaea rhizosphaerae]|uniref:Alkylation response protein AidB-like acyl-CoA dehydrogenase n=1 Tax=Labedaea rhizosphaerae TaxID=598644 RepID=A0A4R6S626_LABRH|nr:acyl-CoA dehydrogenase family protein [Labedaea rhizosphaerae]TDP95210.1 alkylation response protein AidB-like acyl-CoA dehydrogenase [Labedaea rhizosphaerae]